MTSTVAAAVDAPSPSRERRGLERTNNFNLIRVIAAVVVIFDHSYRLVGQAPPLTGWLGYTDIGTIAVYTFFIMSGHLLTSSWAAHPRIVPFFVKRFMRIMPGLVFALLFGALVVGPLMTTVPLSQYIHDPQTSSYVWQNLILFRAAYNLPGVFGTGHNPFPAVNGSIWTLCYEVTLYCIVPIIGVLMLKRWRVAGAVLLLGFAALPWYRLGLMMPGTWLLYDQMSVFTRYFLVGAVLFAFRDRIPMRRSIALVLLASLVVSLGHPWASWVSYVTLPYEIVFLARLRIPGVAGAFQRRDPSYGIYVLGFPIQQAVISIAGGHIHPLAVFAISVPVTFCCALISWTFIEAPAMRLRSTLAKRRTRAAQSPRPIRLSPAFSHRLMVTAAAGAMAGVIAAMGVWGVQKTSGSQLLSASAATLPPHSGAAAAPKPVLIYLHGLGEPADHPAMPDLLAAAAADGYRVIMTDEGGLTSWGNKAAVAAVAALKAKYSPNRPVTLIGCSMGTLTLLSYLAAAPPGSVSAAVGLLPFSHLPTTEHLDTIIPSGATNPPTVVNIPYQLWWGTKDWHAGTPTITGPQVSYVPMVGEGHDLPIPYNLPAIFRFLDRYRAK
ncbi:MAG TPA: acyltransferase [Candidatus Dormibacteraeota bacterium]|nr:acyltransferase [Candidatus Dormibacteraeota bacterium]